MLLTLSIVSGIRPNHVPIVYHEKKGSTKVYSTFYTLVGFRYCFVSQLKEGKTPFSKSEASRFFHTNMDRFLITSM